MILVAVVLEMEADVIATAVVVAGSGRGWALPREKEPNYLQHHSSDWWYWS